ncbi:hypothetical protein PC114_g22905 [Phytophthora cactorum]|nr:hypothetical protein PC114_g22905 [Phytophthora cactorum]KAG3134271.1 hypothetical protein PC128_g26228 [Phytophthora cactorum]
MILQRQVPTQAARSPTALTTWRSAVPAKEFVVA